jgi:3-methyl-2-oxobutanoate hydroxymethyltransferase
MSKELPVQRKVTAPGLRRFKEAGERFSVVTACDFPSALAAEEAGLDVLLVGDSLGMVELGYPNTLPVTMDEMVHHCRAVSRGARRPLLVGDMPFLSYQVRPEEAVANAGRFVKEGGMDAVKLEGAGPMLGAVRAILDAGVPVMGHVGLTPQSIHRLGGYKVQGKSREGARRVLDDALALEAAGCFAVVLEAVPARLAALVTSRLGIPTVGIGAGAGCDAQVLVFHDLLGLLPGVTSRFVKRYESLYERTVEALSAYRADVESRAFPAAEHVYEMPDDEWAALEADLADEASAAPDRRVAVPGRRGNGRSR